MSGQIVAWFASALDKNDEKMFQHSIGDDRGQQTWEQLCPLVGLKAWSHFWLHRRCAITVKGDNMTALYAVLKLKAPAGNGRFIARELSTLFTDAHFEPDAVEHVPGISNVTADALSRRYDPAKTWSVPPLLVGIPETILPLRTPDYYSTLKATAKHVK